MGVPRVTQVPSARSPACTDPALRQSPEASAAVSVLLTVRGVQWRKPQQLLGEVVGPHQG